MNFSDYLIHSYSHNKLATPQVAFLLFFLKTFNFYPDLHRLTPTYTTLQIIITGRKLSFTYQTPLPTFV